jgi:excisionase family DNA binding protein
MNPASKRFYSVKDAASLLGVSTNMIYAYLKSGKIVGKRLGRGRYRIPFSSLSSLLDVGPSLPPSVVNQEGPQNPDDRQGVATGDVISPGSGDIVFYRLFRGLLLLGLGAIYLLFPSDFSFLFSVVGASTVAIFLSWIIRVAFIICGLFFLSYAQHQDQKYLKLNFWMHIFLSVVLAFCVYFALFSGYFELAVYLGAVLIMAVSHFVRGFSLYPRLTFRSQFVKFIILLAVFDGIAIIFYPDLPVNIFVSSFVLQNKTLFLAIWFFVLIPLLLYSVAPDGVNRKELSLYIGVLSGALLYNASSTTTYASWDVTYAAFLTGTFGIVLSIWEIFGGNLSVKSVKIVTVSLVWISALIFLSISVIRAHQKDVVEKIRFSLGVESEAIAKSIDSVFQTGSETLVKFATNDDLKKAILSKDNDSSREYAKQIFAKYDLAHRVVVQDKDGIAIASYPRNSLVEGTNFSSREYFYKVKDTGRPFISAVSRGVTNAIFVVQSEPVFDGNNFIGVLGVALSLDKINSRLAKEFSAKNNYSLSIIDRNGFRVVDSDIDEIGAKAYVLGDRKTDLGPQRKIMNTARAVLPQWDIYLEAKIDPAISDVSRIDNIVASILIVNTLLVFTSVIWALGIKRELNQEGALEL